MIEWISVEDRLPEIPKGEIFSADVYVTDGEYISRAAYSEPTRYDDHTWTYTGIGRITHWCAHIPLPGEESEA